MSKRYSHQLISLVIALALFVGSNYFLLVHNNSTFPTTINHILDKSQNVSPMHHLIILGVLPIYIATTVFGTGLLSNCLRKLLNKLC